MKVKRVKKLLFSEIKKVSDNISSYCFHPEKDFTRNRKLSSETILKGTIGMESASLTNELIDLFRSSEEMPILAVDGTDIQIPTNPKEKDSYYPESDGQKGYNILHLNALYDLSFICHRLS